MRTNYSIFDQISILLKIFTLNFNRKAITLRLTSDQQRFFDNFTMEVCKRIYSDRRELIEAAKKKFNIYSHPSLVAFFTNDDVVKLLEENDIAVELPNGYKSMSSTNSPSMFKNISKPSACVAECLKNITGWTYCEEDVDPSENWFAVRAADGDYDVLFIRGLGGVDLVKNYSNGLKTIYHKETGCNYYNARPCKYSYWKSHPEIQYSTR